MSTAPIFNWQIDCVTELDGYHGHLPFLPFEFEVWEVSMSIVASTQVETFLVATNLSGLLNHFLWHQPPRTKRHLVLPTMSWFDAIKQQAEAQAQQSQERKKYLHNSHSKSNSDSNSNSNSNSRIVYVYIVDTKAESSILSFDCLRRSSINIETQATHMIIKSWIIIKMSIARLYCIFGCSYSNLTFLISN